VSARVALALALSVGCRGAARHVAIEAPRAPSSGALIAPPARPPAALWTTHSAQGIAGPIGDIGALDGGEAVVLAGGVIYRWRGAEGVEPVCAPERAAASSAVLLSVQADGDRFVALGGDEAEPVVWRSDDRGARCELVRLPRLFLRDTPRATLAQALHGASAFVWGSTGAIVRSDDGGHTWRRLPSLARVLDMAPGPGGATLAAVAAGPPVDHPRARLYALAPAAASWRPVEGAELLRAPVSLAPAADGATFAAHADGALRLDASLAPVARRVDPASRYASHRARVIVPAGEGSFLASTGALLLTVEGGATDALVALAGARTLHAIDASRDGWMWATDERGLWRGRVDGPFAEVSSHPLSGQAPVAFAAREGRLLVVGNGRAAAYRDGAHPAWRRLAVPDSIGTVLGAHIDARGALFVLGASGLAVSDAGEFIAVSAPALSGASARFVVMGDRWVIVSGSVYTSDDHGARWDVAYETVTSADPTLAAAAQPPFVAAVARGVSMLALDATGALWRSDDAASTFARAPSPPPAHDSPFLRNAAPAVLAWDGARRIAILRRGEALVSTDGGRAFATERAPFVARWAAFAGGTLVAAGGLSHLLPPACRADDAPALFARSPGGWRTEPDACARRGTLIAHDDDRVWLVDGALTAQSAPLDALVAGFEAP
jgi:photosystem II stability/assembly factor-like uncharacterized protein